MRKLLSLLLAFSVFACTFAGTGMVADAAGWPSYAKNVSLDKTFIDKGYQTDPYSLSDGCYMDIFRFNVPASGTITLKMTSKTDAVPPFRIYRTDNTEGSVWFGYNGNRSSYDYSSGGFYSNWSIDLAAGSYYLMVLYGNTSMNVNYQYLLKYRPYISNSSIRGIKGKRKAVTLTWGRASDATGYKIQYSTRANMANAKTITVKNASAVSKTIKGLKSKKTYYFRIKAYKTVNISGRKKTCTTGWSSKKRVKTK